MAKEISPYSIRRTRQSRRAQLTVLAEDADSNIQEDLHQYWRIIRKHLGLVLATDTAHRVPSGAFLGALLPVLFAYGGFHYLNDLAGEVRNPQRTLPRALGMGMAGVVACYVLVNVAYLAGLGVDDPEPMLRGWATAAGERFGGVPAVTFELFPF